MLLQPLKSALLLSFLALFALALGSAHAAPGGGVCSNNSQCNGPMAPPFGNLYNGYCSGGHCSCYAGITGEFCQCNSSASCSGRGVCNAAGTCDCHPVSANGQSLGTWSGARCNCHRTLTCSGHGSCNADGTCACDLGWAGDRCDDNVSPLLEAQQRIATTSLFFNNYWRGVVASQVCAGWGQGATPLATCLGEAFNPLRVETNVQFAHAGFPHLWGLGLTLGDPAFSDEPLAEVFVEYPIVATATMRAVTGAALTQPWTLKDATKPAGVWLLSDPSYTGRGGLLNFEAVPDVPLSDPAQLTGLFTDMERSADPMLQIGPLMFTSPTFMAENLFAVLTRSATTNLSVMQALTPTAKPAYDFLLGGASTYAAIATDPSLFVVGLNMAHLVALRFPGLSEKNFVADPVVLFARPRNDVTAPLVPHIIRITRNDGTPVFYERGVATDSSMQVACGLVLSAFSWYTTHNLHLQRYHAFLAAMRLAANNAPSTFPPSHPLHAILYHHIRWSTENLDAVFFVDGTLVPHVNQWFDGTPFVLAGWEAWASTVPSRATRPTEWAFVNGISPADFTQNVLFDKYPAMGVTLQVWMLVSTYVQTSLAAFYPDAGAVAADAGVQAMYANLIDPSIGNMPDYPPPGTPQDVFDMATHIIHTAIMHNFQNVLPTSLPLLLAAPFVRPNAVLSDAPSPSATFTATDVLNAFTSLRELSRSTWLVRLLSNMPIGPSFFDNAAMDASVPNVAALNTLRANLRTLIRDISPAAWQSTLTDAFLAANFPSNAEW